MNKSIFCTYLIIIIAALLTSVISLDKAFQNKISIINHGSVTPQILSESVRPRRSVNSTSEVRVSIRSWILRTQLNNKLIMSSNFTTHWVALNQSIIPISMSRDMCEHLDGHVVSNNGSCVIMTICGENFYIYFHFNNRSFTVNPIVNGTHILEEYIFQKSHNRNMNYLQKMKRDLLEIKQNNVYNLIGDTFNLDDGNVSINMERAPESNEYKSQNYFSNHMRISPKRPKMNYLETSHLPGWLELGIAVDYSVIDFHGDRVQQYILALLNIVSAIYRDPSLDANLTLVIVRMIFYIEKKDGMVRQGNARRSLENVNKWNRNVLLSTNKTHDIAIWLTRLDIGGPSGYAPVSGVCDPSRSCALNRDEGLTSAFIIAHELAHILGLTHDGDETADNFCGREALMGSVMAPMVAATFHRFHWSACSKEEYHRHVQHWTCLNNYPDINNVTSLKEMLHDTFTMDEQCRMEFGDGYELCRSFELPSLCSHLWCSHISAPQVCKTKKGPPLDGTACGEHKWCVNGNCEPVNQTMIKLNSMVNNVRDGGWSEWSSWSKCTTSCGVGIRLRSRYCDNPSPMYGGSYCIGNSTDVVICQQIKCPRSVDLRQEQCGQLSSIISNKNMATHKINWLPHIVNDVNSICRLTCRSADTGRIYISSGFVIDGTPCSYNSSGICIQGQCHSLGCDNVLNSEKRIDACGICDGDSSTCISISNKFQRNIRRANTRVAIVPAASYNINIDIMFPVSLINSRVKFMLRDGRRRKYEMKYFDYYGNSSTVVAEGTEFKMERNLNQYKIYGRGPTLDDIVVSIYMKNNERRSLTIPINFHYVTNNKKKNEILNSSYSWSLGGWSSCSATCGGGTKRQTIACKNDQTGGIVKKVKCLYSTKPVQKIKHCNTFSCQFKWIVAEWESCTKTCGAQGIQQRQIYCVHSSFPDDQVTDNNTNIVYQIILPPNICQRHPPDIQRNCNRFPCRGDWTFTEWSTCSRSCGEGLQSRSVHCVSINDEDLFNCDGKNAPDELRVCKNRTRALCYKNFEEFCQRDKSQYCIIPNLKKYCQISEFRKYCCRTCSKDII